MTEDADPRKTPVSSRRRARWLAFRRAAPCGGVAEIWKVTREDMAPPALLKAPLIGGADDRGHRHCRLRDGADDPAAAARPPCAALHRRGRFQPPALSGHGADRGRKPFARLRRAPRPVAEVAAIGRGLARALADLHAQNVLHLDIKPSNIIRRASGEYALIDFGLSRQRIAARSAGRGNSCAARHRALLAPEQILGDRSDPRSDIFSLGVVLYYLLTGERPFGLPRGARLRRGACGAIPSRRAAQSALPALAAGGDPALPGARRRQALRLRRAAGARTRRAGTDRFDRARRKGGRRRLADSAAALVGAEIRAHAPCAPHGAAPRGGADRHGGGGFRRRSTPAWASLRETIAGRCRRAGSAARLRHRHQDEPPAHRQRQDEAAAISMCGGWSRRGNGRPALSLPSEQVTAHVLEAVDPGGGADRFRPRKSRRPDRDRCRLSRSPHDRASGGADRRSGPLHGHAGAAARTAELGPAADDAAMEPDSGFGI